MSRLTVLFWTHSSVHILWINTRTFISPTALNSGIRQHSKWYCIKARTPRVYGVHSKVNSLPSVLDAVFIPFSEVFALSRGWWSSRAAVMRSAYRWDGSRAKVEWNLSDRLSRLSFPCQSVLGITRGKMNAVMSFKRILIYWLNYTFFSYLITSWQDKYLHK